MREAFELVGTIIHLEIAVLLAIVIFMALDFWTRR